MHAYNFFVRGPKFTNFFPHNSGWDVVDQVLFRFLLCQIGPEIFAIKVESYQKIVPNFLPSHILLGAALPKVVPTLGYAVDCFAHSGRSSWSSIYLHLLFQYSGTTFTNLTAFTNICSWSIRNKLTINIVKDCKTKEIAFHRPTPQYSSSFAKHPMSISRYIIGNRHHPLSLHHLSVCKQDAMQINQRLYLLSQLKLLGLNIQVLHTLFTGLIMSKILYALPPFAGQLTFDDIKKSFTKQCLNCQIRTLTLKKSSIASTTKCFPRFTQPRHCLHHILPPKTSTCCPYSLRKGRHYYQLPQVKHSQYKNSFINHCLFNFRWLKYDCYDDMLMQR